jgi:hypothetical protein
MSPPSRATRARRTARAAAVGYTLIYFYRDCGHNPELNIRYRPQRLVKIRSSIWSYTGGVIEVTRLLTTGTVFKVCSGTFQIDNDNDNDTPWCNTQTPCTGEYYAFQIACAIRTNITVKGARTGRAVRSNGEQVSLETNHAGGADLTGTMKRRSVLNMTMTIH